MPRDTGYKEVPGRSFKIDSLSNLKAAGVLSCEVFKKKVGLQFFNFEKPIFGIECSGENYVIAPVLMREFKINK